MRPVSNNTLINGSGADDPSPATLEKPMQHARMLWRLAASDSVLAHIETMEGKRCEFRVFDLPDDTPFPEGWSQTPWNDDPEPETKKKSKTKVSNGDSN